jgi:hypothetical protein
MAALFGAQADVLPEALLSEAAGVLWCLLGWRMARWREVSLAGKMGRPRLSCRA